MLKNYDRISSLKLITKAQEFYKIRIQITKNIPNFVFKEFGIQEPKEGDILDVEYWLGALMTKAGYSKMITEDFENEVLNSLNREKLIGQYQLGSIKPDFYVKLKALLLNKEASDISKIKMYAMDLLTIRINKIVHLALQGAEYEKLSASMTPEESILFQEIKETIDYWKLRMLGEI